MPECTLCKTMKQESEFHKNAGSPSGITRMCKMCRNETARSKSVKRINHVKNALSRQEKKCIGCLTVKNISEFPINRSYIDGRLNRCIECRRSYKKGQYSVGGKERANSYYHKNSAKVISTIKAQRDGMKIEFINLLGGKCSDCKLEPSADVPIACFDFHHEGSNKDKGISQFSRFRFPYNYEEAILELSKCVVLCANCHRKHHYYLGRSPQQVHH